MLPTVDVRAKRLHRHADLAVCVGMFDFLDTKAFAAASVGAIVAALCYISGMGGDLGLLGIPSLVALIYWRIFDRVAAPLCDTEPGAVGITLDQATDEHRGRCRRPMPSRFRPTWNDWRRSHHAL
jgi:hypothetical protein